MIDISNAYIGQYFKLECQSKTELIWYGQIIGISELDIWWRVLSPSHRSCEEHKISEIIPDWNLTLLDIDEIAFRLMVD